MSSQKRGRVDEENYEVQKRTPNKPISAKNHFYITKKTNIAQQLKRIEELLNNEFDEVYLHGLGDSLNRALTVALQVQQKYYGSIDFQMQTSTVNVTDDLFPMSDEAEMGMRQRPLSAVHIMLFRAPANYAS